MTKVKLTKKLGSFDKDQVLTVDDASAKRMVDAKQATVVDAEKPAQDS